MHLFTHEIFPPPRQAAHEIRREGGRSTFFADCAYIRDLYCLSGEGKAYADMFSAMLEWIDATSGSMRSGAHNLLPDAGAGPSAWLQLVDGAGAGDWSKVMRLVGDIGLSPFVCPAGAGSSALETASSGGHQGLVLYMLRWLAESIPTGPHGNLEFSSGAYKQIQAGSGGVGAAQSVYTLRALEMVRSHSTYTGRLRAVHRLVGERREWMEEGEYRVLFSNTGLNLLHAEEVLSDMKRSGQNQLNVACNE